MRIGLPKGRFAPVSQGALDHLGIPGRTEADLRLAGPQDQAWMLKARDIAWLVANGDLDVGLVPSEWVAERGNGCAVVGRIPGYDARISLLTPQKTGPVTNPMRVATEFPVLAAEWFTARGVASQIIDIAGSAEAFPPDLADIVVDCVETGRTAQQQGLMEQDVIHECAMTVVVSEGAGDDVRTRAGALVAALNAVNDTSPLTGSSAGLRIGLYALPPILRAACLPAVRQDAVVDVEGMGSMGLAASRGSRPSYLVLWDRSTDLQVTGVETEELVQSGLGASIRRGDLRTSAPDLFELMVLLATWDDLVRSHGLLSGRVYLASEEAVCRLYEVAGLARPTNIDVLLVEAQSLELIYRFPVAFKFRGTYGGENQCRLNGWGRRLARQLTEDEASQVAAKQWADRIDAHLRENDAVYREHIEYVASLGLAEAPEDSWKRSSSLPAPVLL